MKEGLVFLITPCAAERQRIQVDPFREASVSHKSIHPVALTREKKVAQLRDAGRFWSRSDICRQPVLERPSHHEFVRAPRTTVELGGKGKHPRVTKWVRHLDGAFPADEPPISVRGIRLAGEFAKVPQSSIRIGIAREETTWQFLPRPCAWILSGFNQRGRASMSPAGMDPPLARWRRPRLGHRPDWRQTLSEPIRNRGQPSFSISTSTFRMRSASPIVPLRQIGPAAENIA